MSNREILSAEGEELDKLAGKMLIHEPPHKISSDGHDCWCIKCGKYDAVGICSKPDLIDTSDWNEAMKWRDRCVDKYGESKFVQVLYDLFHDELGHGGFLEIIAFAQPQDIFKAILLCEKGQE